METGNLDIMPDASEIVHYNVPGMPLYVREGTLSFFTNMRAHCHWHPDFEFMQILKGPMRYFVDGKRVELKEGDCLFVNSQRMHYGYDANRQESFYVCTLVDPQLAAGSDYLYEKYMKSFCSSKAFSYYVWSRGMRDYEKVFQLLDDIHRLAGEKSFGYEMEILGRLQQIILSLIQESAHMTGTAEEEKTDPQLELQRVMVAFISRHYHEPVTLEEIAESASVSKSTCCRLFSKYLGQTPFDFLNSYRLEVSSNLLSTTKKSVSEIAADCGFNNSSYFALMFQKRYGMKPTAYRKTNLQV